MANKQKVERSTARGSPHRLVRPWRAHGRSTGGETEAAADAAGVGLMMAGADGVGSTRSVALGCRGNSHEQTATTNAAIDIHIASCRYQGAGRSVASRSSMPLFELGPTN